MPQSRRRYCTRLLPRPFCSSAAAMASTAAWNVRPENCAEFTVLPGRPALLLLRRERGLRHAATTALVDERGERRVVPRGGERHRMLGGDRHEGRAEECIGARGEHLQRPCAACGPDRIGGVGKG